MHQAREHFALQPSMPYGTWSPGTIWHTFTNQPLNSSNTTNFQVKTTLPTTSSTCPSCTFTPNPTPGLYHPSLARSVLLRHWICVHPSLLTWVQDRFTEVGKQKSTRDEAGSESDEEDDIRITEI